jgi:DNA-binding IclR family transcriptional regulator
MMFSKLLQCGKQARNVDKPYCKQARMARPALSASRCIDIIDFLASFPARAFTLSEIARAAKINVASCHAVISALVARGYLTRGFKQRTYVLGPALIAAGQAALVSQPLIARAHDAAEALSAELGLPVLLSAVAGDEIVAIWSIADAHGHRPGMQVGERKPLVPPVGAVFLAWSSEPAIDAWIARKTGYGDIAPEEWLQSLALIRKRGFQVTLRTHRGAALGSLMAEMASRRDVHEYKDWVFDVLRSLDQRLLQPNQIAANELYDVILIAAPIFNEIGEAVFSLCLGGFSASLKGSMIEKYAEHLVRACLRVMRAGVPLRARSGR